MELGKRFDLDQSLQFGLLPIVWDSPQKTETLAAYTQLYLKEEIQAEALTRNLPGFSRFLPIAALFHSQTVNVTNIARDEGIARTTVAGFLQILEDTLLCFRVPAYEAKLRVRERKLPKWYWCDPGLVRAMKRATGDVAIEEKGVLFEGLVAQLLRASMNYFGLGEALYYWAPSSKAETEVDFLLVKGGKIIALEAKSGKAFSESWCKGLRAVASLKGLRRRIIVYPAGPSLRTEDGIEVLPFTRFAEQLTQNFFTTTSFSLLDSLAAV
jgi:uncharacterized protein